MPRTKGKRASRPASQNVGLDDTMPSAVLDYFLNLPTHEASGNPSDASTSGEPSSKRRRLEDVPSVPSICMAKGDVLFTRLCAQGTASNYTARRRNIEKFLWLDVKDKQLAIRSRPLPKAQALRGSLWLNIQLQSKDYTEHAKSLLAMTQLKANEKPGTAWVEADLEINQQGKTVTLKISLMLFWNESSSPYHYFGPKSGRRLTQSLIDTFCPSDGNGQIARAWSPMDFYEAAFIPPKDNVVPLSIEVPAMDSTLFPYQKRTLQWLLGREGMRWSPSQKSIEPLPLKLDTPVASSFRPVQVADGQEAYINDVFQSITTDVAPYRQAESAVKGGILAEEMGLGKTLEIIGLILLHGRSHSEGSRFTVNGVQLLSSGATLIVTPESLRKQWISEISRHAPTLRLMVYEGCKKVAEDDEGKVVRDLANCDVVITTYSVLTAELHFTNDPPERSRRYERAYRRMKSPLVQISWWRLCLDEAQMVENGYSQAASVARVIPRVNAWGITGTPVKDHVKDLFGLLLFLRYEPYASNPVLWDALITGYKSHFQQLFKAISLRHTKALVRDELSLPPQKRYVISMPFTAVEEQHYQSLVQEMCEECNLDAEGVPVPQDGDPNEDPEDKQRRTDEKLRMWLNRLRQTVLHPEVGAYSRGKLGQTKAGPMRTVEEVLDAMIEQSENTIRTEQRTHVLSRLTRGQLYENSPRVKEALAIWKEVKKETTVLVSTARTNLKEAVRELRTRGDPQKPQTDDESESPESDEELDEVEGKSRIGDCRRRLRTALDLHHRAIFFCANAYFQIRENPEMTEPDSPEFERLKKLEDEGYEEAKVVRREFLGQRNQRTDRLMAEIARKASEQSFAEVPELVHESQKGIESGSIVEGLEVLYAELNEHADVVDLWRERVIQLLLRPLVDEEDDVETTGEELGDSAKYQDELMVYVQALRALVADRLEAISGQPNELIKHETDTSLKMAKDGEGPAPEKLIELLTIRTEVKPRLAQTSMRGAVSEFRQLFARLADTGREAMERQIVSDHLKATQAALLSQNKAVAALELEIESFTAAMNARLEYYRQLQAVSDGVLPYEGPRTDLALERMQKSEDESRRKLSSAEAKHRYLLNLKESGSKSNEPRMCVICQMPFVTGVLTVCGHQFCKECMAMWFKAHHNCPVCKRALKSSNLHDITIKPQELQVHSEGPSRTSQDQPTSPRQGRNGETKKSAIYSEFNAEKLAQITSMELDGPSFTTKVDTLVRHLLWLRESDPGAKSIVFSQYKEFLKILQKAFKQFRIGFASIDEPHGIAKFKDDPAVECFLLHARAHSSGLNLVNASHVFLCEPLLNTALELQAIARVDRIGQQHETTVWLYYVTGTVEESIHNMSVRRRMEHMGRNLKGKSKESTPELLDANIEAANTLELENAALSKLMSKDRTAGEEVDKGDLWECLFGHILEKEPAPERDSRLQQQAVMSYLAGEAAEERRGGL